MSTVTYDEWRRRAADARRDWPAFIAGKTGPAASGATFAMVNPATGKEWAQVASGDAADIDRAVASGRAAFEDRRWAGQKPRERKAVLLRLAELMQKHKEELALLETLAVGKPIVRPILSPTSTRPSISHGRPSNKAASRGRPATRCSRIWVEE